MRVYVENAQIPITEIAMTSSGALLCRTDRTDCCGVERGEAREGEWFYPDGTQVLTLTSGQNFSRSRRTSVVRLNRKENAMQPTGRYCCEVGTVVDTDAMICVNLSE
jgi:hypothetical protein